jgi:hydroxyacylglutathione hydrolase
VIAILLAVALGSPARVVELGSGFVNAYALVGERVVLVDTHYPRHEERLIRRMRRAGLDPGDVSAIVVTHAHADHAGSAGALHERLGAPILAGAADVEALEAGRSDHANPTGLRGRLFKPVLRFAYPPTHATTVIETHHDLATYGVEGEIRVVGGHTPGSVIVDLGDRALIGDLVRGRLLRHRRPTLHFFHQDVDHAHRALAALAARDVVFYPGHGGPLTSERVRAWLARAAN